MPANMKTKEDENNMKASQRVARRFLTSYEEGHKNPDGKGWENGEVGENTFGGEGSGNPPLRDGKGQEEIKKTAAEDAVFMKMVNRFIDSVGFASPPSVTFGSRKQWGVENMFAEIRFPGQRNSFNLEFYWNHDQGIHSNAMPQLLGKPYGSTLSFGDAVDLLRKFSEKFSPESLKKDVVAVPTPTVDPKDLLHRLGVEKITILGTKRREGGLEGTLTDDLSDPTKKSFIIYDARDLLSLEPGHQRSAKRILAAYENDEIVVPLRLTVFRQPTGLRTGMDMEERAIYFSRANIKHFSKMAARVAGQWVPPAVRDENMSPGASRGSEPNLEGGSQVPPARDSLGKPLSESKKSSKHDDQGISVNEWEEGFSVSSEDIGWKILDVLTRKGYDDYGDVKPRHYQGEWGLPILKSYKHQKGNISDIAAKLDPNYKSPRG